MGQLCWTPDGKAVIYVRGGDLEFLGRPDPNPAADPAGVDQAIWIAAPGEAPRKIAGGHSPVISPKGDRIAYLLGGQIWIAPLAGWFGLPLCFSRDPASRRRRSAGLRTGASSPLSAIAAITASSRCTISARKSLSYLDPSVDRDRQPCLVARRQAGRVHTHDAAGRGGGRGGRRAGDPWTHPRRQRGRWDGAAGLEVRPGPGSVFRAVVAGRSTGLDAARTGSSFPGSATAGRISTPSPVEGGTATLLTPGEFEVEHVSYSADASEIVYSSNQGLHPMMRPAPHLAGEQRGGRPPARSDEWRAASEWSPVLVTGGDRVSSRRCEASRAGDGPDRRQTAANWRRRRSRRTSRRTTWWSRSR